MFVHKHLVASVFTAIEGSHVSNSPGHEFCAVINFSMTTM